MNRKKWVCDACDVGPCEIAVAKYRPTRCPFSTLARAVDWQPAKPKKKQTRKAGDRGVAGMVAESKHGRGVLLGQGENIGEHVKVDLPKKK